MNNWENTCYCRRSSSFFIDSSRPKIAWERGRREGGRGESGGGEEGGGGAGKKREVEIMQ